MAIDAVLMFWGAKIALNRSMFSGSGWNLLLITLFAALGFAGVAVPGLATRALWLLCVVAVVLLMAYLTGFRGRPEVRT
ncbi:hypothetical protein D9M68_383570 [compost metagenome]